MRHPRELAIGERRNARPFRPASAMPCAACCGATASRVAINVASFTAKPNTQCGSSQTHDSQPDLGGAGRLTLFGEQVVADIDDAHQGTAPPPATSSEPNPDARPPGEHPKRG